MKDFILSSPKQLTGVELPSLYRIVSSWSHNGIIYTMDTDGNIIKADFSIGTIENIGTVDVSNLNMAYAEMVMCVNTDSMMFWLISGDDPIYTSNIYEIDIDSFTYSLYKTHYITAGSSYTYKAGQQGKTVIEKIGSDIYYRYYFNDSTYEGNDVIYYKVYRNDDVLTTNTTMSYNFTINTAFPLVKNELNQQFMFGYYYKGTSPIEYNNKYGFTYVNPPSTNIIPNDYKTNFGAVQPFELGGSIWCISPNITGSSLTNNLVNHNIVFKINKDTMQCEKYDDYIVLEHLFDIVGYFKTTDYVILMDSRYKYLKFERTTFTINLYKNSAEANRVDKTDYLTAVGSLNGVMRDGSSITDLSITFEMDTLPQFNYVHIPAFNRYYFVDDIATVKYRLWEMALTVDVLMTYKDAIYALDAFVTRNEFDWNNNLVDSKRVIEQGYDVETAEIDTTLFDGIGSYVLTGFDLKVDNTGG